MKKKQVDAWKISNNNKKLDKRTTYITSKLQHRQINEFPYGEAILYIKHPEAEDALARQKKAKEDRNPKELIAKLKEVEELTEKLNVATTPEEIEELNSEIDKPEKLILKLKDAIELTEKLKEAEGLSEKLKEAKESAVVEGLKTKLKEVKKVIVILKKGKDETIYSSNLLKFTFHLLAIMVLNFNSDKITSVQT